MELTTSQFLPETGNFSSGLDPDDLDANFVPPDQYTLPNEVQVGLFCLYGINIFISVAGNIVVICVFSLGRKSRTELAPFLINLAVSDLIMAVFCMPFTSTQVLLGKWIYPHFLCPAVSYMQHSSVSASIYTQTFISIDRLRSICRPFRTRVAKTGCELLIILGFIWVWSLLQAGVQLYVSQVQLARPYQEDADGAVVSQATFLCLETWPASGPAEGEDPASAANGKSSYSRFYTVCVFSVDYVIPLLCIGCAYSYVGRKLWERTTPGEASDLRDRYQLQSKRKVIKMLALMVLSFGILWLPLQTFFLLHDFSTVVTDLPPKYYHTLFVTCHFFAMLSVIVNIIIYVLVNKNFKSDFRYLVSRNYCCKSLPHSEAHRQAVALRRTPAFHGYAYHRQVLQGFYSKDNSHSNSPMHPYGRPASAPYDITQRSSRPYSNGSCNHLHTGNTTAGLMVRRSPHSLPNIRSGKRNYVDYSSCSDV